MRIGVIRRSHDFHQQQRRRASSAVNPVDYSSSTGSPRSVLSSAINRRASAAVTEGGGGGGGGAGGLNEDSLFGGRTVSLGGCSSRVRQEGYQFGRSSSQDSNGAGSGHDSDGPPTPSTAVAPAAQRGESMDLETDDLCYGKVLSVLGIIFGVLLLTLAFATVVRYIYR